MYKLAASIWKASAAALRKSALSQVYLVSQNGAPVWLDSGTKKKPNLTQQWA